MSNALDDAGTTNTIGDHFGSAWQHRRSPAQPKTLACEAQVGDGQFCGAEAKVRCVHYRYTARLDRRLGEVQQVLSEAIYEIACPRCGWRTQIQKVERN